MSPAGHRHGRIVLNITTSLDNYVRRHNLGVVYAAGTGFQLASNPDTVRTADVAFISQERVDVVGDTDGYWPGAPDLVIELVSPNDLYTEIEEKVIDWLDAGTQMVVIINPRKRLVKVYRSRSEIVILTETDTLDGADVVTGWQVNTGWQMPIRDIFA